jgi:mono/diheme cytochrome c family protein
VGPKAKLTVALLAAGALSGTALALGVGRPPRPENPGVAALRDESRFPGRALFTRHNCVVCHGADGGGTDMGPGLGAVMPEYLAAAQGNEAAAIEALVAYLKSPKWRPTLRRDSTRYPNPMPSAEGLGLGDEDLRKVAAFILRLRPKGTAVGGDGGDR